MVTRSANIATETRPLADWMAVALSCPGSLELAIGENHGITIEAEDNILPVIETIVTDGRLVIRFRSELRPIRPTLPIRFQAASPTIDGIAVSGSGDIRAPDVQSAGLALNVSGSGRISVASATTETLETRISGAGSVSIRGRATEHEIHISGSGDLHARDLTSQQANITISGSGNALIRVEREITGRISGSGSIVYSGQPAVRIRTTGSGRATQMPT